MDLNYIRRLQEARLRAWEGAKAILDASGEESRDITAEERVAFDKANADIDAIDAQIKELESRAAQTRAMDDVLARLTAQPQSGPVGNVDPEQRVRAYLRGESGKSFDVAPERRDNLKSSPTGGGNTVPTSFYAQLWAHLIETATLLQAGATVLNTASGENLELPTTTAHSSAALTAEGAAITESDPAFAKRTLGAYKYASLHQVSSELIEDAGVDLLGYLAMQAGRAAGNAFGAALITGTGSSQPAGIATGATVGVTGAASVAGAFTADNLIDLFYSVIAPYRNSMACGWLLRDATMAAVRKLKDTTNQYLWQPSIQLGTPDMLLGKPVYTDPTVAAVALSARSVLFGDFSAYYARVVGGFRFERSDDFAFSTDLVTFRSIVRGDGILLDQTGAVKCFIGNAA